MIEVKNLSKEIGGKTILRDLNFQLPTGAIVGLLGRNGAGKTTLLRTLIGIILPDEGEILVDGESALDNAKVKERMVYVSDVPTAISRYNVKELVNFYAAAYPDFDRGMFSEMMARYKLPHQKIRHYSKGMKALLAIILAFCTRVDYILMDEPTSGLDPIVKRQVLQFIIDEVAQKQVTVLISTHHLDEVEKIADTFMMMNNETIESVTSLDDAKELFRKVQVAFAQGLPEFLNGLDQVKVLNHIGKVHTLLIRGDIGATLEKIRNEKPLLIEELPMSLEDIFVTTLGGDDYVG